VRVEEIFIDTQEVCIANAHQLGSSFVFIGLLSSQVDVAEPGDNVRMKVKGIEEEDLRYGFVMCQKDSVVQGCRYFDAKVNILEYKSIICPGYISVMHIHAATEEVAIMHLLATLDKKGQVLEKKPKFVKQGQVGLLFECLALRRDLPDARNRSNTRYSSAPFHVFAKPEPFLSNILSRSRA
jgi:translation elongation factor EF-1alpha